MSSQEPNSGSKPPLFNGSASFSDMFNCCIFRDSVITNMDREIVPRPDLDQDLPVALEALQAELQEEPPDKLKVA